MQASVEGADILLHANRCNKDTTSEGTREGAAIEERDVNGPYISGQWETFINMSVMKPALQSRGAGQCPLLHLRRPL